MASRFRLHEKPLVYPKRDIIKRTAEGPVFDLGVDLENYTGAVYVQQLHIEEMAQSIGMLTKQQADELYQKIKEYEEREKNHLKNAEELKNGIDSAIERFHSTSSPAPVVPEKPAETTPRPAPKSNNTHGQANGSAGFKGSNSVHADSVNESDTGLEWLGNIK